SALDPVESFVLFFFFLPPLALNSQDALLNGHPDIVLIDFGNLGLDEVLLIVLGNIYGRRPIGDSHCFTSPLADCWQPSKLTLLLTVSGDLQCTSRGNANPIGSPLLSSFSIAGVDLLLPLSGKPSTLGGTGLS